MPFIGKKLEIFYGFQVLILAGRWYNYLTSDLIRRKRPRYMKSGKVICLLLVLSLSLLWPQRTTAQSQEEQPLSEPPAQTAETVVEGIDPLASVLTVMNIPARAALCGLNSWFASIVMAFSAGMRYADAAKMIADSCSGPWIITPEMVDESGKKEPPNTPRDLSKP